MVCHWFTLGRPAAHGEGSFPPEPSLDGQGKQGYSFHLFAGVTQLVECQLPKLNVAGSSPVARSATNVSVGVSASVSAGVSVSASVSVSAGISATDGWMSGAAGTFPRNSDVPHNPPRLGVVTL